MRFALVIDNKCAGFVLQRRREYEAFSADEISLGLWETEDGAISAIYQKFAAAEST